ncbi:hypothetical protein EYF80_014039 [Liparis tanakae]|uniref:Uncharacterized protein n=1 Tax=Liparis tanakae TaxID=230148 RepID=A0A4Z2ICL2_9TELE|nr:hypothetical protein EYF80_014039 [Liparis tanakae]
MRRAWIFPEAASMEKASGEVSGVWDTMVCISPSSVIWKGNFSSRSFCTNEYTALGSLDWTWIPKRGLRSSSQVLDAHSEGVVWVIQGVHIPPPLF